MGWLTEHDLSALALALVAVGAVLDLVIRVVAFVVVPRDRRPSSAMAWLLALLFVPLLGALAYLLIGSPRLPEGRRAKQRRVDALVAERVRDVVESRPLASWPPWLASVVRLNQRLGAMPLVGGNDAEVVADQGGQLTALTEAVRAARGYVHVEFYILSFDDTTAPFFAALEDAVARGVEVRLLLDHLGSRRYPGYRRTLRELDRAGVDWRLMLPVQPLRGRYQRPDLRNHRKLLVADGCVAFVGSGNVIDRGYQTRRNRRRGLQWHDVLVRLTGPVVHEVDAVFSTDWFSETDELLPVGAGAPLPVQRPAGLDCQVLPSGPGFDDQNNLKLFTALVHGAQRHLGIVTPYFVPDEALLLAVTTAADRGVEVELFVGEIGDQAVALHAQHSYYEALLDAGVRIWLYPPPYVLHAKHLSVDDDVVVVGSSNMDMRSFVLDLELSVMVRGARFVDQVHRLEDSYRAGSRELTRQEWAARGRGHVVLDGLARLTSALQ